MSVCPFDRSLLVNSCLKMGSRIRPGKPVRVRRSSSRSNPASSVDSPSRNRSVVSTLRDPNDGRFWPAMFTSCPSVLLSTVSFSTMSPSKVTRGVMLTMMPTGS